MKNAALEDEKLVKRSIAGEEAAFESLVRKYQKRILSIIYQITGNKQEAEDIAQEIFIKVFYKLKDFNPQYPFFSWLYRITINKCYDHLRATKRKKTKSFAELNAKEIKMINNLFAQHATDKTISLNNRIEVDKVLNKLLGSLRPEERAFVAMRDIENLSYKEMAQIFKCSELAARIRVSRARKRLRIKLEKYLEQKI